MAAKKSADLTVVETGSAPATQPAEPTSVASLAFLERLMANPEVSLERVEHAWTIHQKMQSDLARKAYFAAFAEMQKELPVIERKGTIKNRQGETQSTYAKWDDVVEQINPVLGKHGFALSFRPRVADNKVALSAVLSHREGHSEQTPEYELPADTSGSKNAVQALGSSTQYAKRYVAFSLLNIISRDEQDDDGQKGGGDATLTDEQIAAITKLLEVTFTEEANFMAWVTARFKYPSKVAEIRTKDFEEVRDKLEAKRKQMGAGK